MGSQRGRVDASTRFAEAAAASARRHTHASGSVTVTTGAAAGYGGASTGDIRLQTGHATLLDMPPGAAKPSPEDKARAKQCAAGSVTVAAGSSCGVEGAGVTVAGGDTTATTGVDAAVAGELRLKGGRALDAALGQGGAVVVQGGMGASQVCAVVELLWCHSMHMQLAHVCTGCCCCCCLWWLRVVVAASVCVSVCCGWVLPWLNHPGRRCVYCEWRHRPNRYHRCGVRQHQQSQGCPAHHIQWRRVRRLWSFGPRRCVWWRRGEVR